MFKWAPWIIALVAVLAALAAWWWPHEQAPQREYIALPAPEKTARIERVEVPVERVVVLEKQEAARRLAVPPEVALDPAKQITTAGEVAPHEGKTTVTAVLDTNTGETTLIARQEKPPPVALQSKWAMGLDYDYSTLGQRYELYGRWNFLRLGNWHLSARAYAATSTSQNFEAGIGGTAEYQFAF